MKNLRCIRRFFIRLVERSVVAFFQEKPFRRQPWAESVIPKFASERLMITSLISAVDIACVAWGSQWHAFPSFSPNFGRGRTRTRRVRVVWFKEKFTFSFDSMKREYKVLINEKFLEFTITILYTSCSQRLFCGHLTKCSIGDSKTGQHGQL